jgi:acyl carrier protein
VNTATLSHIERRQALCRRLREMIVDRLDLPVEPDWITIDQPLFGRGLELDSVDALELVSGIEYELDVAIEDDDPGVFGSVNMLADYIERRAEGSLDAAGAA